MDFEIFAQATNHQSPMRLRGGSNVGTEIKDKLDETTIQENFLLSDIHASIGKDLQDILKQNPKPVSMIGVSDRIRTFYEHAEVKPPFVSTLRLHTKVEMATSKSAFVG